MNLIFFTIGGCGSESVQTPPELKKMICKVVEAENFRNIESCRVEFSPGVNVLVGDNAQGKTNLIEAIYFAAIGRSFRGAHEAELLRFDCREARTRVTFTDSLREQTIEIGFSRDKNRRVTQNGVKVGRMSEIVGRFRAVLFCPEHLNIIKEGPSMRRQYLDVAISQLRPLYMRSLQKYNHILAQRNRLLKSAWEPDGRKVFEETSDMWSAVLAHEAAFITASRIKYLETVAEEIRDCFGEMTGGREVPGLEYVSSAHMSGDVLYDVKRCEEQYYEKFCANHEREIAAGATLWGVHKDDVDISINGRAARQFASQGQQRSLSLALKLAEGAISRRDTGEEPVFLLDDVFSELDAGRRTYLTGKMKNRQIILSTCTERDGESADAYGDARVVKVRNGEFITGGSECI